MQNRIPELNGIGVVAHGSGGSKVGYILSLLMSFMAYIKDIINAHLLYIDLDAL